MRGRCPMVSYQCDNMRPTQRDKGPCISDSEAANQSPVNVEHSSVSCWCLQLRYVSLVRLSLRFHAAISIAYSSFARACRRKRPMVIFLMKAMLQ